MEIHYHPEFFFIFYSQKLEKKISQKKSQIRQIFTLPPRKKYQKIKKIKKIAMGFVQKRNKKKGEILSLKKI
jgi:hypothetical protein